MGIGPAAEAIFFMLFFAAEIIVGVLVLAYVARCLLVVVQETGNGHDEIAWPSDPIADWLTHAVLLAELLGLWLVPAGMLARMLRHVWLPDANVLRVLLLAGPGLWLFFPIGLLSSMTASSRWVPFRWTICTQLLRVFPTAIGFYAATAGLLGVAVALWYFALVQGRMIWLLPAALVTAAVVLIYARLVGRLAWLIQRLPSSRSNEQRSPAKSKRKKKRKKIAEVQDPWDVPKAEAPRPKRKSPHSPPLPHEIEAYGIAAEPSSPAASPPPPVESQPDWFADQVRQHIAERERALPPPPPHPLLSGVYSFPWYPQCMGHWLALALCGLVIGGITAALIHFGRVLFQG